MSQRRTDVDRLREDLQRIRREVSQRIVKPPKGAAGSVTRRIAIAGGNTLATGQDGIKFSSSTIASVPSAYDPTVTSTFIDGIGRGTYYVNGVSQGYVLVVNDGRSGSLVNFDLLGGTDYDVGDVATTVSIDVSGGGGTTVTAYVIGFI